VPRGIGRSAFFEIPTFSARRREISLFVIGIRISSLGIFSGRVSPRSGMDQFGSNYRSEKAYSQGYFGQPLITARIAAIFMVL
jgi:hypothetical protein